MAKSESGFYGRGWDYPVIPDSSGRIAFAEDEEAVKDAIMIIIGTSPGERVMRPEFGCGVWELVHEPNNAQLHGRVQARVREALVRWEPRIDVLDVRVESPAEFKHRLDIHIDFRYRANNTPYNLVYPFFLQEGVRR